MPIDRFPARFSNSQDILENPACFEAGQVYTVKGTDTYLMIIEEQETPRSFSYLTADDLGGEWTDMGEFVSPGNVEFPLNWTSDISHGDIFRENPDQTHTIDACNLEFLYQGRDPAVTTTCDLRPYRPGLLTMFH
jgi:endo-1,4-beta-xylanase